MTILRKKNSHKSNICRGLNIYLKIKGPFCKLRIPNIKKLAHLKKKSFLPMLMLIVMTKTTHQNTPLF